MKLKSINSQIILLAFLFVLNGCSDSQFSAGGGKSKASGSQAKSNDAASTPAPVKATSENGTALPLTACVSLPSGGMTDVAASGGTLKRNTYYFRNVAVDPGKTKVDASTGQPWYMPAMALDADSNAMAENTFKMSTALLAEYAEKKNVQTIEWTASAHEFGWGLDSASIDFSAKGGTLHEEGATPNGYAENGYVSITNLKMVGGAPHGDVALHVFNFAYESYSGLGMSSLRDMTNLNAPFAPVVPTTKLLKDIDLSDLQVTIKMSSNKYDTVQYRSIRANLWAPAVVAAPAACSK